MNQTPLRDGRNENRSISPINTPISSVHRHLFTPSIVGTSIKRPRLSLNRSPYTPYRELLFSGSKRRNAPTTPHVIQAMKRAETPGRRASAKKTPARRMYTSIADLRKLSKLIVAEKKANRKNSNMHDASSPSHEMFEDDAIGSMEKIRNHTSPFTQLDIDDTPIKPRKRSDITNINRDNNNSFVSPRLSNVIALEEVITPVPFKLGLRSKSELNRSVETARKIPLTRADPGIQNGRRSSTFFDISSPGVVPDRSEIFELDINSSFSNFDFSMNNQVYRDYNFPEKNDVSLELKKISNTNVLDENQDINSEVFNSYALDKDEFDNEFDYDGFDYDVSGNNISKKYVSKELKDKCGLQSNNSLKCDIVGQKNELLKSLLNGIDTRPFDTHIEGQDPKLQVCRNLSGKQVNSDEVFRLPKTLVKDLAKSLSSTKISSDAFEAIELASNTFFQQVSQDLGEYAKHASRKTIALADVELLMKRQRLVDEKTSIFTLAHRYLPAELLLITEPRIKRKSRGRKRQSRVSRKS
ncbi:hypothetical protein NADFUDRAFT_50623 [Nadsonia fulvescens var. elongata DSM 6958]|uniref:CENP-T/Histone H4 histone fold domain-containing protein n=1 Tax=Nadsonia fulvescens var. elongata DSM 6958 TaxID=857566 RepID=A0A1E3PMQ1_9ASCO|nr:hypothetical protein NADFUDRAFT_50623 [Nadsonia fulvescens var. elongata DSM 6958]